MWSAASAPSRGAASRAAAPASSRSRRWAITSFLVTRPRRPLPSIRDRSRSCFSAMRRTTGVTDGVPPFPPSEDAPSSSAAAARRGIAAVWIVANTVPTSTVSPASTSTSFSRPLAGAGTSLSALSVEISTIGSSASTASPGCFFHATTVPSAIDTPIWGIVTSINPSLVGEELTAGLLHVLDLWQHSALERRAERDRHVRRGDTHNGTVKVLEGLLCDQRRYLRGHTTGARGLLD